MRATTFERLVRERWFASEVATTVAGRLGLARPTEVLIANARLSTGQTGGLFANAYDRAVQEGATILIHTLAVLFIGFEDASATDVRPDFAVLAPDATGDGPWLDVGDAKDRADALAMRVASGERKRDRGRVRPEHVDRLWLGMHDDVVIMTSWGPEPAVREIVDRAPRPLPSYRWLAQPTSG